MNPKTETPKNSEIKYLQTGATDNVESEPSKRGKKPQYDIEAIATVLKNGKKYVLPSTIQRVNVVYDIIKALQEKKINAGYDSIKGTVQKVEKKSKKGKPYSYTTAQYFLFIIPA